MNNYGSVLFCLSYYWYCGDSLMSCCKFCLYMNAVVIDDICFLCYCLKMRFVCYCKEIVIEMRICSNQNVFCIGCLVGWNIVVFGVVYICYEMDDWKNVFGRYVCHFYSQVIY